MSPIVKTFIGKHIDLSKVVAISKARFIDRMGNGGWFVGFDIDIQLRDEPIKFTRKFNHEESNQWMKLIDEFRSEYEMPSHLSTPSAVKNLQKEIDILIEQWMQVREQIKS